MPASLLDTNVWIAAVFPAHPFHSHAQQALEATTPGDPAVFCRATEQGFLRLVSTRAVSSAYDVEGLTNRDALAALDVLLALPQVVYREEPAGTEAVWRRLAARDTPSPKVWMDAYLAAFALGGGLRLVSLDRDFQQYAAEGLDLTLLAP